MGPLWESLTVFILDRSNIMNSLLHVCYIFTILVRPIQLDSNQLVFAPSPKITPLPPLITSPNHNVKFCVQSTGICQLCV